MKDYENHGFPESYRHALLNDPLVRACVDAGMSYPEIIGKMAERAAEMAETMTIWAKQHPMRIVMHESQLCDEVRKRVSCYTPERKAELEARGRDALRRGNGGGE